MVIAAVTPNCAEAASGETTSTPEPQRRRHRGAQQHRTSRPERLNCRPLRFAYVGVLFTVAMNDVDGIVHPDSNGQRRDDRRDDGVGDAQQRHSAQHTDEHEDDGPHRNERQRRLANGHPEEDGEDAEGHRDGRGDRRRLVFRDGVRYRDRDDGVGSNRDGFVIAGPERLNFLLEHLGLRRIVRVYRELEQHRVDAIRIVDQYVPDSFDPLPQACR